MLFRKQPSPLKEKELHFEKAKETKSQSIVPIIPPRVKSSIFTIVILLVWFFAFKSFFHLSPTNSTNHHQPLHRHQIPTTISNKHSQDNAKPDTTEPPERFCEETFSVYVYELPAKFNKGMLNNCAHLNIYTNMCPHVANSGLGQPLQHTDIFSSDEISSSSEPIWFATHQFLAEMIFHERMECHPCRTLEPSLATIFYVSFYGGLHASSNFREANLTDRDELAVQLFKYMESQPWFKRNNGNDHFLALGRTAWDFMRAQNVADFGANSLLNLPASKNMSVLTVERNPWNGSNQYGIPYSTYFHPRSSYQIAAWQKKMIESSRPHLFSFIGGPRKGVEKAAVRDELIKQCGESSKCELVKCGSGDSKCHSPSQVLRVMSNSQFCLQAPGDSFTRRSTFDSMLAGCIPVFVSPHTAYTQYAWYLPEDKNQYSVYVEGDEKKGTLSVNIEDVLSRISSEKIEKMRRLIVYEIFPRIIYVHPNASEVGFKDAVDVALLSVAKVVRSKLGVEKTRV